MNKENKNNLGESVIQRIKKDNINPYSYLYLNIRTVLFWVPTFIIIMIGAFAFAGLLFGFVHAPWEHRLDIHPSIFIFLIRVIPAIWLVGLSVFLLSIIRALRTTKAGYKYSILKILLFSVVAIITIGTFIFVLDSRVKHNKIIRYPAERRYNRILPPHPMIDIRIQNERNLP